MRSTSNRLRLFVTRTLLAATAVASAPAALAAEETHKLEIAAGEAVQTLNEFSHQTGLQLLFDFDAVHGINTRSIKGDLDATHALSKMLTGTALKFEFVNDRTIAVIPLNKSASKAQRTEVGSRGEVKDGEHAILLAQSLEAAAADSSANRGRDMGSLEEVIVTAQKRDESLHEVPISISVLKGTDLDKSTFQGVREALTTVPGVATFSGNQGGQTFIAMRGVSSSAPLFAGPSATGYYIDSVPFSLVDSAIVPDTNAYDLQRVEVLRGPQGTLYGASALNGVVRVLTNDANLNEFQLKATGAGSYTDGGGGNYRADTAINVPIIDGKLAIRAVAGYEKLSGWIDSPNKNNVNDARLQNYRLKITAQPTDELSINLSSWFSRQKYGAPNIADDQGRTTHTLASFDQDESIESNFDAYGLRIGYQLPSVSITSNTSYLHYSSKYALDFVEAFGGIHYPLDEAIGAHVFTQEIYLNSSQDGPWRWSAGAMYRDGTSVDFDQLPAIATADLTDTSKSYAIFGELSRRFLDRTLEFTLGGRYFHDEVTTQEDPAVAPINGAQYYRETAAFHATTPRAVITWYPDESTTVYTSYSEGFRSGAPQTYLVAHGQRGLPSVNPDKLHNYEIGAKLDFFDRRLSIDAATYYIDWKGVQQNILAPVSFPGGTLDVSALLNAGSASGQGVDFGLTARPLEGLELGVNISWNDLNFDDDVISGGKVLFKKGQRLNFSARETLGGSASYRFPIVSGYEGRFSASINHTSPLSNTLLGATGPITTAGDAMTISCVSVSLHSPDRWELNLFADNIGNWHGIAVGNPSYNATANPVTFVRVRPRTIGAQLDYRF